MSLHLPDSDQPLQSHCASPPKQKGGTYKHAFWPSTEDRFYSVKIDAKRKQLSSVQLLFKTFAEELDSGQELKRFCRHGSFWSPGLFGHPPLAVVHMKGHA